MHKIVNHALLSLFITLEYPGDGKTPLLPPTTSKKVRLSTTSLTNLRSPTCPHQYHLSPG